MKKVIKIFMILLVSFIVIPFTVNAATTTYKDLPNGSYVIGKHIFTREGGALTVKKIMLASRTIEADNMEDMHIIYKDIMGNLKEVSAGKDIDTNQYPEAEVELTDVINYEYYDLVKVIYTDGVIVSAPKLGNLVPIKYNGETWEYADTTEEWYDYGNKEWANAVVLADGVEKTIGDPISEDEIDLWFVWIPRYEYKLPARSLVKVGASSDGGSSLPYDPDQGGGSSPKPIIPKAIDINFISSSATTPSEGYSFHPGFAWDSDWSDGISEWKDGIWIGKFESTAAEEEANTIQKIMIKPNTRSWRNVNVYNMYTSGLNLDTDYGIAYLDSYMPRYTEWTTVSSLTNSIFGKCSDYDNCAEVTRNNDSTYFSGAGDYEKNVNLSTTGNITGIYDLSGSAYEYVMGYASESRDDSGFTTLPTDNKYTDIFTVRNNSGYVYAIISGVNGSTTMNGIFGELLLDKTLTTSWYSDTAISINASDPWYILGGGYNSNAGAGLFASYYFVGRGNVNYGFRVALS